jgi:hypothetical protein
MHSHLKSMHLINLGWQLIFNATVRIEPMRPHLAVPALADATHALVAVLSMNSAAEDAALEGLTRWKRLNPSAAWINLNLSRPVVGPDEVVRMLAAVLRRRHMRADQLIMIGAGRAGRLALELVLQGNLECAGILAIDVDCAPLRWDIAATAAAIRLVVHETERQTSGDVALLGHLRAADIDERIMILASAGNDAADATARAAEAFLLELVAIASRRSGNKGRLTHE